jgi:hypothetical protein
MTALLSTPATCGVSMSLPGIVAIDAGVAQLDVDTSMYGVAPFEDELALKLGVGGAATGIVGIDDHQRFI